MKKRGITPVVATVLLIAIVVVLALIIFLWARGFIKESITKKGMSIEQACGEVSLEVVYSSGEVEITNTGNIPVYNFYILKTAGGDVEREDSDDSIPIGQSRVIEIGEDYDEVSVVPIIMGEGKSTKNSYTCQNNEFEAETI